MTNETAAPGLKVVVLHNVLWSHYKGAVFSELHDQARRRNWQIHVVHVAETERQRVALGSQIDRSIHQYPYEVLFQGAIEDSGLIRRCRRVWHAISSAKPNVVVVPGYSDMSYWVALLAAKAHRARVIVAVDSTEFDRPRVWWKEGIKRMFVRMCDAAFCYGSRAKEYCVKLGLAEDSVFTRCQATALDQVRQVCQRTRALQARSTSKTFLYLGRISSEKNLSFLISAFRNFSGQPGFEKSEWILEIVGGGPELEILKASTKDMSRIKWTPGVPANAIGEVFARADVFVLPSTSEPWGLVVNEAMACGIPVLVSATCGCAPDLVIEGQTGYTFSPTNVQQLTELMVRLGSDETHRRDLGNAALEHIAKFTPATAAEQMLHGVEYVSNGDMSNGNTR